jgi:glycerol-3-phosphate acyltransferase PlsY
MSQQLIFAVWILTYLVASIPVAYLVSKTRGSNVLEIGTGNPGAANIFRKIGRKTGIVVFLWDFHKAVIPVILMEKLGASGMYAFVAGVTAMLGHCYPVFFRFRGGMGLATAFGVAVGMFPLLALAHGALMLVILMKVRDVVVAAIIGYLSFCAFGLWLYRYSWELVLLVCLLPVLAAIKNHFTEELIAPKVQ